MEPRTIEQTVESIDEALRQLTAARSAALAAKRVHELHEVLSLVVGALHDTIEAEARTVATWRAWGASWSEVGEFYGTSKQAAQQRFGVTA